MRACEKNDWYFLVLVGMRGNFEGTRNRVDGCSRGVGRMLCKKDVGWIVDLNNFLASWSLRSVMVCHVIRHAIYKCHLRSAGMMALVYDMSCAQAYLG